MITKLADKWASTDMPEEEYDGGVYDGKNQCASELREALPTWTRITEDESTLPPTGEMIMLGYPDGGHKSIITIIEQKWTPTGHYVGKAWRPLCDIDYPPEQDDE